MLQVAIEEAFAPGSGMNAGTSDKQTTQQITVNSIASAVPEPSSLALIIGGIAAIGASRIRRRRR